MGYLGIFVPDLENVAPKCELVDVDAKLEGERKER